MTRERIYIAPEHADNAQLRAQIERLHPDAEIFPTKVWNRAKPTTKLTDVGEQFVIPGCERVQPETPGAQLDLWGGKA